MLQHLAVCQAVRKKVILAHVPVRIPRQRLLVAIPQHHSVVVHAKMKGSRAKSTTGVHGTRIVSAGRWKSKVLRGFESEIVSFQREAVGLPFLCFASQPNIREGIGVQVRIKFDEYSRNPNPDQCQKANKA